MSLIVLYGAFAVVLVLVILNGVGPVVYTIGSNTYVVSRITRASLEYRVASSKWSSWSWHYRGDVRLYQGGKIIWAVPIQAECAPSGDLLFFPSDEPREAQAHEAQLFHAVCTECA